MAFNSEYIKRYSIGDRANNVVKANLPGQAIVNNLPIMPGPGLTVTRHGNGTLIGLIDNPKNSLILGQIVSIGPNNEPPLPSNTGAYWVQLCHNNPDSSTNPGYNQVVAVPMQTIQNQSIVAAHKISDTYLGLNTLVPGQQCFLELSWIDGGNNGPPIPRYLIVECHYVVYAMIVPPPASTGVSGYTDERYWVQIVQPNNTDNDPNSKLTFSAAPIFQGISGYSGYSGYSGPGVNIVLATNLSEYNNNSGLSGYSGYSGVSGYSGYSGWSGYSGYSGVATHLLQYGQIVELDAQLSPDGETRYCFNEAPIANSYWMKVTAATAISGAVDQWQLSGQQVIRSLTGWTAPSSPISFTNVLNSIEANNSTSQNGTGIVPSALPSGASYIPIGIGAVVRVWSDGIDADSGDQMWTCEYVNSISCSGS